MIDYNGHAIPEGPAEKPIEGKPWYPEADVSRYDGEIDMPNVVRTFRNNRAGGFGRTCSNGLLIEFRVASC